MHDKTAILMHDKLGQLSLFSQILLKDFYWKLERQCNFISNFDFEIMHLESQISINNSYSFVVYQHISKPRKRKSHSDCRQGPFDKWLWFCPIFPLFLWFLRLSLYGSKGVGWTLNHEQHTNKQTKQAKGNSAINGNIFQHFCP